MQREPLRYLLDLHREYGDVVRVRFGPMLFHMVSHPDHVKHVLVDNAARYHKGERFKQAASPLIGNGLLLSEGDFWRRQRRIAQPTFHRQRLARFVSAMAAATDETLTRIAARAAAGRSFDVAEEMARLTLRIVGRTFFGIELGGDADEVGPAIEFLNEHASDRIFNPIPFVEKLPTPDNRRFVAAIAMIDRIIYGILDERRRAGREGDDLVAMLLEARDEETGERMTDRQLRDELVTFYLAGHETTSNALAWTLYLLSKHPTIERELRAEARAVLGDRAPTLEDLAKLRLTTAVIEESMRLYPPAWITSRLALADDEIAGYHVPSGSQVFLAAYVTHRDTRFWDNPEGFDPARFSPDQVKGRPRYAYWPFGGGPRVCIGNHFAMMEMQIIVPMLVRTFRLDLVPGARVVPNPVVTLRLKHGLPMTAHTAS